MKKEITPNQTLKIILLTMVAVNAVVLLIGLIITKEPIPFLLGMLVGLTVSLISKAMLARAVDRALDMEVDGAKLYMAGQAYMRMLLVMAAAVACGFMRNYISIYGLAVSLLVSHLSVYIANFIYKQMGGEKVELNSSKKADRHC